MPSTVQAAAQYGRACSAAQSASTPVGRCPRMSGPSMSRFGAIVSTIGRSLDQGARAGMCRNMPQRAARRRNAKNEANGARRNVPRGAATRREEGDMRKRSHRRAPARCVRVARPPRTVDAQRQGASVMPRACDALVVAWASRPCGGLAELHVSDSSPSAAGACSGAAWRRAGGRRRSRRPRGRGSAARSRAACFAPTPARTHRPLRAR